MRVDSCAFVVSGNVPTISKNGKERLMQYGARNKIRATVTSVKSGDIMSLAKFDIDLPAAMASVMTTESVEELGLEVGDKVVLVVKAIHVLPVME
jgi:molybdopterin-binding protein